MVTMGNDLMATVGSMHMVEKLHHRAALCFGVQHMGDQRPMLVSPTVELSIYQVPCITMILDVLKKVTKELDLLTSL